MLAHLIDDIRYSVRGLLNRPAFAAVVVLILSVGIGVIVTMYWIFDGMVLRPIPAAHRPAELVNLAAPEFNPGARTSDSAGDSPDTITYPS